MILSQFSFKFKSLYVIPDQEDHTNNIMHILGLLAYTTNLEIFVKIMAIDVVSGNDFQAFR